MAITLGKVGAVYFGANQVAEVRSFEVSFEVEKIQTMSMGDNAKRDHPGAIACSGSVTCYYDASDSLGQHSIEAGDSVTLNLYPDGNGSGEEFLTSTGNGASDVVLIDGETVSSDAEGTAARTFRFSGLLVRDTVA